MEQLDEVMTEFLIDCYENLEQLDRDLLTLESHPANDDLLARIFRTIHTIKGNSGFLALPRLEHLTHVGETLLQQIRDGQVELTTEVNLCLLELVDTVRGDLAHIEESGKEKDGKPAILQRLGSLSESENDTRNPGADHDTPVPSADTTAADSEPTPTALFDVDAEQSTLLSETTVRIDVALLDRLMNQVGELVLARNHILEHSKREAAPPLLHACQSLNLITRELQTGILQTRMRSIQNLWRSIPRQVHDLCQALGKQVEVRMEGADTDMDKTVLEAIRGPLMHIVRNALDHGIESPETRLQSGKPAQGTLCLHAFHEGSSVIVEVNDDGGGIDLERVKEKAVRNGLISEEQSHSLPESELLQLILKPGFSTAAAVTSISGRGVGMDVAKTEVERIGGSLELQSEWKKGTTIRLRMPLTLAITSALIVGAADERYAIPRSSVVELLRREDISIEFIGDTPVFRRRGSLLQLIGLAKLLDQSADALACGNSIAVVQSHGVRFGLLVDRICDSQEIVVKPLRRQLSALSLYGGTTILGDGRVALILDVNGVRTTAGTTRVEDNAGPASSQRDQTQHAMNGSALIVEAANDLRMAVPLSAVSRLETIERSAVERTEHGAPVIQYCDSVIPLLTISGEKETFLEHSTATSFPVLICEHAGNLVAIAVERVVDITDGCLPDNTSSSDTKVRVIHGHATVVVDIPKIITAELVK